jgi:hypothetical protein
MAPARIGRKMRVIVNNCLFEVASCKIMGRQSFVDL